MSTPETKISGSMTIETPIGPAQPMILNMGPQHPSTHGVLRVVLELDGETVLKAESVIGYLHTGIEKSCEAKTYSQAITLTDRIDYLAPLSNNLAYCLAVEKLLNLEVPKRAQYIRVLLTELTRIASHLVWLGTHAIDMGAMSVFLYGFREREEILKIFEYASGQRMITTRHVHLRDAHKTPQFWLIWAVLCLNVSAGIGVIEMASPMLQEIFGGALIGLPDVSFAQLSEEHRRATATIAARLTVSRYPCGDCRDSECDGRPAEKSQRAFERFDPGGRRALPA